MAMPEHFSLRWNDFHSNMSQEFHALLEGEDLVDVTLAADGHYVHAHKLILSVCSPYFKELFKTNPCEHPIVFLKDVKATELRQLLHFMYKGEVHIRQQDLYAFLHTAELLQVKGLSSDRETESPIEKTNNNTTGCEESDTSKASELDDSVLAPSETVSPVTPAAVPAKALKRLLKNHDGSKKVHKKIKNPYPDDCPSDNEQMDFDNELYHHRVLEMPESTKEPCIKQEGWNCKVGGVKCPSCHRYFANRYNLKVHIRDKHDTMEGTLQCAICNKRMRNPSCLRVHLYHHRKQAAYLSQMSTIDPATSSLGVPSGMDSGPISMSGGDKWNDKSMDNDNGIPNEDNVKVFPHTETSLKDEALY